MKITAIETHVCHARMRNWIFVKVLTDTPGLWGWGEATLEWHTRSVVGAIEDLAPLLIGQDPTRIEYLWHKVISGNYLSISFISLLSQEAAINGVPRVLYIEVVEGGKKFRLNRIIIRYHYNEFSRCSFDTPVETPDHA